MRRILLLALLALLLASCNDTPPTPTGEATPVGSPAATPVPAEPTATLDPARGGIFGQALGIGNNQPIQNVGVYLAQVFWNEAHTEAGFALDLAQSPATRTDANGNFTIVNALPGEYVIIVGGYSAVNDIVKEADGEGRIITIKAGQQQDVGVVLVKPDVSGP